MTMKPFFLALSIPFLSTVSVQAGTPTNDAAAFETFHLYNARASSGNTSDHIDFANYPASLGSPPLLMVMRPTPGSIDTMALFNSFAKDAIGFQVNATATQSFSTYTVSPPQYASSARR